MPAGELAKINLLKRDTSLDKGVILRLRGIFVIYFLKQRVYNDK